MWSVLQEVWSVLQGVVSSTRCVVSPTRCVVSSTRCVVSPTRCVVSPTRCVVSHTPREKVTSTGVRVLVTSRWVSELMRGYRHASMTCSKTTTNVVRMDDAFRKERSVKKQILSAVNE